MILENQSDFVAYVDTVNQPLRRLVVAKPFEEGFILRTEEDKEANLKMAHENG